MAPVTPTITKSTTGFVDPDQGVYGGAVASATLMTAGGVHFNGVSGMRFTRWHFTGVDDGDTWDSDSTTPPPRGLVAVAWQGDDTDTDKATPTVTTVGGPYATSAVNFDCENTGTDGWLWVLSRG